MSVTKGARLLSLFVIQAILIQVSHAFEESSASACNIVCGRDYNPVCGEQQGVHRTFSNLCMMSYFNCRTGSDFIFLQKNECSEESKDEKRN